MADISITEANVKLATTVGDAKTEQFVMGATMGKGVVVYKDTVQSPAKLELADADGVSDLIATVAGILLFGGVEDDIGLMITKGEFVVGGTLSKGVMYYLSETAGGIAPFADLTSGSKIVELGRAISTTILDVDINIVKDSDGTFVTI